ncbi:hypothetical protein BKP45_20065 [Anaerobacillus alkalidiazotrophicus]|uniref:Uncharacterized protein n=1 Tax=Anaerobacillus alkalidiazotrophicus TaxID=472963 RepID=A0A1S2LZG3_9BACI|nr:hypothetical protein [Anaerobacillus alkalidiazotrophicus]OIJ17858.1 hypothetical protein BKP45_20065 [Anaerobacillus alkalidiazotrophicus]
MFIGSWVINIIFSVIAFLFVFIGSVTSNTTITSFVRATYAFLFFFFVTYFFRWIWLIASKGIKFEYEEKNQIEGSHIGKDTIIEGYTEEEIKKVSRHVKDLIND